MSRKTKAALTNEVPRSGRNVRWFRRIFKGLLMVLLALILVWLGFLNRPRPDYNVSSSVDFSTASLPTASLSTASLSVTQQQDNETSQPSTAAQSSALVASPPRFNVSVVYSPGYLIDLGGLERAHPFDIKKYQKIHNQLKTDGLLSDAQTFNPEPLTNEDLLLVHDEAYLDKLKSRANIANYLESRELMFAPVSLDRAVLAPFRRASGGTVLAARLALKVGIGVNIGGGYHHAKPDRGEGFCLYADVPIAIRKLQNEGLIKRALIVDVDVHQGNGTILCLEDDDSTFTFSMHQENIYPMPKEKGDLDVELRSGLDDDQYMQILNKHLPKVLDESDPDICFIVGGCDTLKGDPLASLNMTHAGIARRDHAVVDACVKRKIPVVLTLSGGYSPNAWKAQHLSIKNLIESYQLSDAKPMPAEPKKAAAEKKLKKK